MQGLQKQWESFMMAVGGPVAKSLIPILQNLTEKFSAMGEWANSHQDSIQNIAKALEALGVGLAVLGGAALIGGILALAGPTGALIALSVAVGSLISVFAGANIPDLISGVAKAFDGLFSAMKNFFDKVSALTGLKFGSDAADSNAANRSLYNAGYGYWNPQAEVDKEEARERSRGLAYRNIGSAYQPPETLHDRPPVTAPPVVNVAAPQVDTKVDVKVTADMSGIMYALAAKIESMVTSAIHLPTSSAGTDGRANHMPPDSYNF